jgi:hypothetical protein
MSNTKKSPQPKWLRHPKSQQEKKEFGKAKEEGVPVRGKRTPPNLGDLYDDKPIGSNLKKQNKAKKPSRDTIRRGEEDEQSISKQMKKSGKATIKGPQVKERKHFAPATKVESPKKGKGSYKRKGTYDEDEQGLGSVPLKGGKRKKPYSFNENTNIAKFIDCILTKNYADADKYIKQAVESKIQAKIEQELSTPLF